MIKPTFFGRAVGFVAQGSWRSWAEGAMSKLNFKIALMFSRPCCRPAGYAAAKGGGHGGGGHGGGGHGGGHHGGGHHGGGHAHFGVAAIVVDISAAVRTSAAVGATPSTT